MEGNIDKNPEVLDHFQVKSWQEDSHLSHRSRLSPGLALLWDRESLEQSWIPWLPTQKVQGHSLLRQFTQRQVRGGLFPRGSLKIR